MKALPALHFSTASLECTRVQPGKLLFRSSDIGWSSLLVDTMRGPTSVEPFETGSTPDQLIILQTRGECLMESFADRKWTKYRKVAGQGALRASGFTSRMRWSPICGPEMEHTHIYVPTLLFENMEEEFRTSGARARRTRRDVIGFQDPIITNIARSLVTAARAGAPDIFAASAAIHIVTHMLSLSSSWAAGPRHQMSPGTLSKQRLERVQDFMTANLARPISLDDLANEAGISRFHFIATFKKAVGTTPYRRLLELRLQAAAKKLSETEIAVQDVASSCGFGSSAHFSVAFKAQFKCTARAYREAHKRLSTNAD